MNDGPSYVAQVEIGAVMVGDTASTISLKVNLALIQCFHMHGLK